MSDKETSKKYIFNRTVIILIFICFAMAAFYFSFQSSDVKGSFLNSETSSLIPEKIDKYIFKKYQENDVRPKSDILADSTEKSVCYEAKYIDSLYLLQRLNLSFIQGKKIFAALNTFRIVSASDKKILRFVDEIHSKFEQNEAYSIDEVKDRFRYLRRDLVRKRYEVQMEKSFFGRVLFKSLLIQKRGTKAIEAGGIEASLERAADAVRKADLKRAYHEVESLQGDYHNMSEGWLQYVSNYIAVQENISKLNEYIHSEGYRKKFYKECN